MQGESWNYYEDPARGTYGKTFIPGDEPELDPLPDDMARGDLTDYDYAPLYEYIGKLHRTNRLDDAITRLTSEWDPSGIDRRIEQAKAIADLPKPPPHPSTKRLFWILSLFR
ncbi:hypothetical protein [Nocardia mexicana]|uniref:Uncharacterized protein n=1 Tax=Nocardia mexicana TaxID=279262 RepID=A0A370H294_9NOCA|nr:hypothetical protein [Nocardia mexicana]RDI50130.1 hypothetical protein DFR68_106569 [Nocardia mexicana]